MNVVTRKHLTESKEKYREAANEIDAWYKVAKRRDGTISVR
jgi:mRNA-degrading endonuclease HigB of HigAB toxin-antitoxin module